MRFACLATVTLVACASGSGSPAGAPPSSETIRVTVAPNESVDLRREILVKSTEFAAPRERVWTQLLATHDVIGIPLTALDEKAGTATYQMQNTNRPIVGKRVSFYVDCGNTLAGPRTETYRVTIKVSEKLESVAEDQTALHTVVTAWAREKGISSDAVECTSTGQLEKKILELLAVRLGT